MSEWDLETRRADVVILTALRLEFDAVLDVDAGAVPGSAWEQTRGPDGLPLAFRPFVVAHQRPLRVAVAAAPDMGAVAAASTLLPLIDRLEPRCIAMCGVCAGRRGKVQLGDVIAAERVYYHDTGKQRPDGVQQDLTTYKLRDDWKAALERMAADLPFFGEAWFTARPLTTEWRRYLALVALRDGAPEPWKAVNPALGVPEWQQIVAALRDSELLSASGRQLTDKGLRVVDDLMFGLMNKLPDLSPTGTLHPFRMHIAPIASGTRVVEDEEIWAFVSKAERKTVGLDMEAAVLGELAHRHWRPALDAVVMKGVMDFADQGRDDHFKEFAARASAECLLWFLREHVPTELTPGFDDVLTTGTLPLPHRVPAPSMLLNARYTVVPWHEAGRSEVLADLDRWADDVSPTTAMRLLHAEGGAGKTRLAIEWVRRRRERYDAAGFLGPDPELRWLDRLCGLGRPVLVVIDYAESRADLVEVLQRVASIVTQRPIRVLLLARNDGDWWKALLDGHPLIAALLRGREPIRLLPLAATPAARDVVFSEASQAFAAYRRLPAVERSPIAFDDAGFQRVLYVHMVALAAIEGIHADTLKTASTIAALDASALMDEILAHEERFWVREGSDRSSTAVDVPLARQLVAAATLRGRLATRKQARELCERLENRPRERADDALIALLHDIYDCGMREMYLPGLEPDLLGEAMVLRVAAPPPGAGDPPDDAWIARVLVSSDDAGAFIQAFTVLGRASASPSHPGAVRGWIARLLRDDLSSRAVLAVRAAKAVGQRTASSMLGDLLADALEQDGSLAIAIELAQERIPGLTVSLRRVAAWQSRVLLEYVSSEERPDKMAVRALLLRERAARLDDLHQLEPALAAAQEAVALFRVLAMQDSARFQPELARTLIRLGIQLSQVGQAKPAVLATGEAVRLYFALAEVRPNEFEPALASSLDALGNRLSDLGSLENALEAAEHAVDLYRHIVAQRPGAFDDELANSLSNLGNKLSKLGRHDAALTVAREGAEILRAQAQRNPDAYQPAFANSLNSLAAMLCNQDQPQAALATIREAVDLRRALAARNPEPFQIDLANSLTNLARFSQILGDPDAAIVAIAEAVDVRRAHASRTAKPAPAELAKSLEDLSNLLAGAGQYERAREATREAVGLRRSLAAHDPDAFRVDLASSVHRAALLSIILGDNEAAIGSGWEAAELYRALALRDPATFRPQLASTLGSIGGCLHETGQDGLAPDVLREAADLYRTLAEHAPDAFASELASNLHRLGAALANVRQHEPARAAFAEAIELYRRLVLRDRDAFQARLAECLVHTGVLSSAAEYCEPALVAVREGVGLYEALAADKPDMHALARAHGYRALHGVLMQLGNREAARDAIAHAVDICRAIANHKPDTILAELADNLAALGGVSSDLGLYEAAHAAIREAIELHRIVAARSPDRGLPSLAKSLGALAAISNDLDQREPALAAIHEAAHIQRILAQRDPEVFQPALADSLDLLSALSNEMGQREHALTIACEVAAIRRGLAARSPEAFQVDLAMSLHNLGTRYRALGHLEPACAATREAVELRRTLAASSADALPDLARSLTNLGAMLGEMKQPEAALIAAREAVEIRRALVERDPEAALPDLANSLSNLANAFDELSDLQAAHAAIQEAVGILRALELHRPGVYTIYLMRVLNNLAITLGKLGEHQAALAACLEAVDLSHTLTRDRGVVHPMLPGILDILSLQLLEFEHSEAALAVRRDVVELYRGLERRSPGAFVDGLRTSLVRLGTVLDRLGLGEEARAAMREAEELRATNTTSQA